MPPQSCLIIMATWTELCLGKRLIRSPSGMIDQPDARLGGNFFWSTAGSWCQIPVLLANLWQHSQCNCNWFQVSLEVESWLTQSCNCLFFFKFSFLEQIEMIYKIIAHMAANDRALIAEGSCGSPRSIKVYLGECNIDDLLA